MSLAIYVVNDNPSYIAMLGNSVKMLRKYSKIPAKVIFVENNAGIRRDPDGSNATSHILEQIPESQLPVRSKEQLFDECEKLGVEVCIRQLPDNLEEDYDFAPVHRMFIEEFKEENVLFLDCDTFIFKDVEDLFELYKDFDFAATPNLIGASGQINNYNELPTILVDNVPIRPYNSGVIVWNNGWCSRWASTIYEYCRTLRNCEHKLGKWLVDTDSVNGREELACNLFVMDYKLKATFLEMEHCYVREMRENARPYIFHSTCKSYCRYFNKINTKYNRKIKFVRF